jgi:hypothetical protein
MTEENARIKRFILALDATTERHKAVERACAARRGETYPTDAELLDEVALAFEDLSEDEKNEIRQAMMLGYISWAIDDFIKKIQTIIDAIVKAFNDFADAVSTTFAAVDWHSLYNALRAIDTGKHRPQRRPDPVSQSQVQRAIKHLPNTLAVLR